MTLLANILHPIRSHRQRRFQKQFDAQPRHPHMKRSGGTKVYQLAVGAAVVDVFPPPSTDGGSLVDISTHALFYTPGPDDVVQGPRSICYILAALIALSYTAAGCAYLQKIITAGKLGEFVVFLMRGGTTTAVHVGAQVPGQISQTGPEGDVWVPVFLEAYEFFRTGANTVASLDYGFTNSVLNDMGLASTIPQPRNVAEARDMLDRGMVLTILTGAGGPRGDIVKSHAYGAVSPDLQPADRTKMMWRNPWGPNAGMPLFITIGDTDVALNGIILCVASAPPAAEPVTPAPIPIVPAIPQAVFLKPNVALTAWGFTEITVGNEQKQPFDFYFSTDQQTWTPWLGVKTAWNIIRPLPATVPTWWRVGSSAAVGGPSTLENPANAVIVTPNPVPVPVPAWPDPAVDVVVAIRDLQTKAKKAGW